MQYLYLMRVNRTKKLLQEGRVAFGCSVSLLRSAEIPRMYAAAGLDWIFIDTEHGPFTVETIQDLVRSCSMTTITPIVRVADFQYSLVARALDMGAEGIIFPRVDSAEVLAQGHQLDEVPPARRAWLRLYAGHRQLRERVPNRNHRAPQRADPCDFPD